MACKYKILISWFLLIVGVIAFLLVGSHLLFVSFVLAAFIRDIKAEKNYWKYAGTRPGPVLIIAFIWCLICLGYILYKFNTSTPIGSYRLSTQEWMYFGLPIVFVYIYYEIQLFNNCEQYYNK